jgi:hypothetical protein
MPHPQFDRSAVRFEPLSRRENKKEIEKDHVPPGRPPGDLSPAARETIAEAADRVRQARKVGRPVMVSFGAHAIKNGLGPVFIKLIEGGWVTHLATNGAAIIHDWEFAFQGKSCEHVGAMVKEGRFGNWEETGYYINLAINLGVWEGRGYGVRWGLHPERMPLDPAPRGPRGRRDRRPAVGSREGRRRRGPARRHPPVQAQAGPHHRPPPVEALQRAGRGLPPRRPLHRPPDVRP